MVAATSDPPEKVGLDASEEPVYTLTEGGHASGELADTLTKEVRDTSEEPVDILTKEEHDASLEPVAPSPRKIVIPPKNY